MQVFISYRRDDSSAHAGRLADSLARRLGREDIFQDVATINPGEDFDVAIDRALAGSDAALVVIGPEWMAPGPDGEVIDPGQRSRGTVGFDVSEDPAGRLRLLVELDGTQGFVDLGSV